MPTSRPSRSFRRRRFTIGGCVLFVTAVNASGIGAGIGNTAPRIITTASAAPGNSFGATDSGIAVVRRLPARAARAANRPGIGGSETGLGATSAAPLTTATLSELNFSDLLNKDPLVDGLPAPDPGTLQTPGPADQPDNPAPDTASADDGGSNASPAPAPAPAAPRWVRPNYGPITSPFGRRWGRLHAGVDLGGRYGSPILAATDGTVIFAGAAPGYGRLVKIADSDGTQTWYGHMSRILVHVGETVHAGEEIATVGAAGDATGPHLHFEVRVDGVPVDPVPFLAARGVRL